MDDAPWLLSGVTATPRLEHCRLWLARTMVVHGRQVAVPTTHTGVGDSKVDSTRARLLSGTLFFPQVLNIVLSQLELFLEPTAPSAMGNWSQLSALIFRGFMSLLQTSLQRSYWSSCQGPTGYAGCPPQYDHHLSGALGRASTP